MSRHRLRFVGRAVVIQTTTPSEKRSDAEAAYDFVVGSGVKEWRMPVVPIVVAA